MIDRNDPRLTAFALGEMNEQDRAGFEKELENDPAARAEIEAIRALGGRLRTELTASAAPALTDAQRASVTKAARRRVPLPILLMPIAACLLAAVAIIWDNARAPRPAKAPAGLLESKLGSEGAQAESDRSGVIGVRGEPGPVHGGATPSEAPRGFQGPNGTVQPGIRKPSDAPAPVAGQPSDPGDPGATFANPGGSVEALAGSRTSGDKAPVTEADQLTTPGQGVANGLGKAGAGSSPSTPASRPEVTVDGRMPIGLGASAAGSAPLPQAGGDQGALAFRSKKQEEAARLVRESEVRNSGFRDDRRLKKELEGAKAIEPRDRLPGAEPSDREGYDRIRDNPFLRVSEHDSSTFSIDVDTASYSNVRRFLLQQNRLPPPDAVRIEEMVNYFSYAYEPPAADSPDPFRVHVEVAQCPWDTSHRLARIGIKGKVIDSRERPASNLVFLIDVSGSMNSPEKLPLVQASLRLLALNLGEKDRVAIVVYAGAAGLVLPSTGDKQAVADAIDRLRAGGSTAGAAGIQLAYQVATENLIKGGVNRVILCTDGDFNVGVSDDGSLTRLIEDEAKTGVFLSVLGFGTGNYQDGKMQQLADKGNGNHAYIDSIREAKKVLGDEMSGTLVTIAKDVKIQVFFNPRKVAGYRLIGYENRMLAKEDFNDDTKDAGEIGAGHTVTALYELVPAGSEVAAAPPVDENPFVAKAQATIDSDALFQLKLRYKEPDGDKSKPLDTMVRDDGETFDQASADFRWAGAVAAFGMNLRGTAGMGLDAVLEIAKGAAGEDGYRREFLQLVETAKLLTR